MKRRIIYSLICVTLLLSLCACGKKKKTVGESLIKDNPGQIQGLDEYVNNNNSGIAVDDTVYKEPGTDMSNNMVSDNSVSEGAVSNNGVSNNDIFTNNGSTVVSDNTVDVSRGNDGLVAVSSNNFDISAYENNSNNLTLINMSGKSYKQIYVTFSSGNINNREILGKKRLKDAATYSYKVEDMDSLKNADYLKVIIKGVDKKDKDVDFGEIDVIDPTNMIIVLTEDGMYMK